MCTLTKVLTRFRQYNVAFTGDISKMFLKILVPEEFRKYHRVIWVGPDRKTRRIFQFTRHLFGNQGSPTASMWTAQKNAFDNRDEFPEASDVVINSTIVDDHQDSSPTAEGALKILCDLVMIYNKIGLKLAKVTTNSAEVLDSLPSEVKTSKSMKDFSIWSQPETELNPDTESKMPRMRTLGQQWSMITDFFSYLSYTPDKQIMWNKLYCLSQSAQGL
jgi:hypothetical protein